VETGFRRALRQLENEAIAERDIALPQFREELALRLEAVDVEGEDLVAAREAALDRLREERSAVQDWARAGRIAAAKRSLELARAMVTLRRSWLQNMPSRLAAMEPTPIGTLIVRAAPFADEA
jgi:hypothetical protein